MERIERIERYRRLCETEVSMPIFMQDWWLDIVTDQHWDVCLVVVRDLIAAAMPYSYHRKMGLKIISQPPMTQTLGPWINPQLLPKRKIRNYEHRIFTQLIDQLPKFHYFHQCWHPSRTDWLPFYWKGYEQSTRYTYRIEDLSDLELLWKNLSKSIRSDILKSKNRYSLKLRTDCSIDIFIKLFKCTFKRQSIKPPYSDLMIKKLDQETRKRGCRHLIIAEDAEGRQHAGVYIVWDKNSAYYLLGGADPDLRTSGAGSYCLWAALEFSTTVSNSFDFEGSMIEPIANFFSAFGSTQKAYFSIRRYSSPIVKFLVSSRAILIRYARKYK